jgi:hypothetical protein
MVKLLGALMTILGLFSVPEDFSRAYTTTQQFLSTDSARWAFVVSGITLLLVDKWWPHVPFVRGLIAISKIRLCGLKNLRQLSTNGQAGDRERTTYSALRGDLERNMELLQLCDLIAGGYIGAWRFNQATRTLEVLTPERLSVIRPAIIDESSSIYIKRTELARARSDYAYDQRALSQVKN